MLVESLWVVLCVKKYIYIVLTHNRRWRLGHTVEDVQGWALCGRHHRVPLLKRGYCQPGEPGSQVRRARHSQLLRHHWVLRSEQPDWRTSSKFHDSEWSLPHMLYPRDQSRHFRPSQKQVQHWERRQGNIWQQSEPPTCSCLSVCYMRKNEYALDCC